MPLRDLFNFGNRTNPFESWPSAPKARSIAAGRVPEEGSDSSVTVENDSDPYLPTLIIAFGETGEKSLRLLTEKISQSNTSGQQKLRGYLIKETTSRLDKDSSWPIRVLEIQMSPTTTAIPRESIQSLRFGPTVLFQQVSNYRKYQEWLQENLLDLGWDTQVFFVGSIAEPIVSLLGETLQILRCFPENLGKPNLFSRVAAFLSLKSSAANPLPAEEIFAAYREIGRFSFPGPHLMNASYGIDRVVRSALLDALFLLDDPFLQQAFSTQTEHAQLLAESLFTFIHPSARNIWENLRNDLPVSGQIRNLSHQSVAHSLGIATLYIPVHPIKRYVAARLACAVLLGEQDQTPEGLVHQNIAQAERPDFTARRFLTNGPYTHPVFEWILNAISPSYFNNVPDLTNDFITTFQAQISHNLVQALNNIPADTIHICHALEWLENHLVQCEGWFIASKPVNANTSARFNFQYVLSKWRESVQTLAGELRSWNRMFFPSKLTETPTRPSSIHSDWRVSGSASGWRHDSKVEEKAATKDIPGILKSYRENAEKILITGFNDRLYRSVVSDANGSLDELQSYYSDTVRPELSRFTSVASSSFMHVCNRLEWWIRLIPDHVPQLYLVCWPPQANITTEPPSQYCFGSGQIQDFVDSVFALAFSQTMALESDLTRSWFRRRIRLFIDFLRRADDSFLSYDQNLANLINNAATRRSYLISQDPTLSREIVSHVFSETPRFEINEVNGGDPTRITATSLRLNIPFGTVTAFQDIRREYVEKSPEKVHLYAQEQIAVAYEKRIWKLERMRILLSPDFVTLLTDQQLVTIFCQALFTGVISPQSDENDTQQFWTVTAVEDFTELELAPCTGDGLLTAFRKFVLELPNEPDLTQNPHRHFYRERRIKYLTALMRQIKVQAIQSSARAVREKFTEQLEFWKRKGEQDELARSFSVVLQCEFDEPVWKNW